MKRSFWILSGLLALLAAWVLWPSGNQPAALAKKIAAAPAPVAAVVAATAVTNHLSVATAVIGRSAASTNREFFRLTNTAKTLGELTTAPHAILLENALIDTASLVDLKIPAHLRATGDPGAYIVQARGVVDAPFRAALANAGAQIVSYIPNNAYLVRVSAMQASALSANTRVQAVLPYEPYYKISSSIPVGTKQKTASVTVAKISEPPRPTLLALAAQQKPLPPGTFLTLGLFGDGAAATISKIEKLGGKILSQDRSPFGLIVHVQPPTDWISLALLPGVQLMEPATRRASANDLSRMTTGVAVDTQTATNYLGLTGKNVMVEVNDTGIDATHPDLIGRVFGALLTDTDGHGTHVAGIIAGDGTESTTVTNASGSIMPGTNGQFRGSAPLATLLAMDFNNSDQNLQETAALTNALISNNSWVYGGANAYDLAAASYDAAVRDALPEVTGPQPVLFVFAAGNSGGGDDAAGSGGNPDSIESPATAKDVITVGALEQFRNITNVVTKISNGTTNTTQPWLDMTSTSYLVPGFSARGNVGIGTEGTYGRYKPDVTAPGTFVVSTRSGQWDTNAYYNPTNYASSTYTFQTVSPGALNSYSAFVPQNAVGVTIQVLPNSQSAAPFPANVPVYVSLTNAPTTNSYDILATNSVAIPPASGNAISGIQSLQGKIFNFAVGNTNSAALNYDVQVTIATTNDLGDYYQQLQGLNDSLGTMPEYYRYETGTSMAAADVSGVLALMQDFFTNKLSITPSPALLKAMLINGARPTGFYDFQVQNQINYQGWGLVNLPNSIPASLANSFGSGSTAFFYLDQSVTNALATGDSRTYSILLTPDASALPLRVTLAWTDPPGNPAAAIKLVNNLDLVVTNLDDPANPLIFYGNDIAANNIYNTPEDTNTPPNFDAINNVENVFLPAGVGTNFTITVIGRGVNVNAVTTQTNDALLGNYAPNIVQDFALVISSGDGSNTNGFSITSSSGASNPTSDQNITIVVSTNSPLMNQMVGAASPVLATNTISFPTGSPYATNAIVTIGQTNQWHFYIVTNTGPTTDFTNAAFVTFLPDTLAIPREGVFADTDANSTRPEADIDLYVTTNSALLNLDPVTISNAILNGTVSLSRGGTEFVVLSNSSPGQVYYVGVKSEDQMASEYAFLPEFSNIPFSQMNSNGESVTFFQVDIPDGDATHPGYTNTIGLAIYPIEIQRVVVTNILTQQNPGDLVVSLNHSTTSAGNGSVVLMNHDSPNSPGTYTQIYDDSGQGDIPGSQPADGPGSLRSFALQEGQGVWILHAADNAPAFSGNISSSLFIEKHQDLQHGIFVTIKPGEWFYGSIDIPVGYTNLIVAATNFSPVLGSPSVQLYLDYQVQPTLSNFLAEADLALGTPPGNSISYGPPLAPGTYYVGLFNPGVLAQTVFIIATPSFNASAIATVNYASDGAVPLLDDAVNYASIFVTNTDVIQNLNVGLRVDHPRISDLVFHLISPDGTRYLLMENRGGQSTNGCGVTVITTNVIPVSSSGGSAATTNFIPTGMFSGSVNISYNMFTVPDQMTVYYSTNPTPANQITNFTTSGAGQFTVSFPPVGVTANSTYLTIVMNATNNQPQTFWTYTVGGVQTNYYYLTFTEDTNLTTTPIKFATPPFVPNTVSGILWTDNFDAYTAQAYPAPGTFGTGRVWTVLTNQVDIINTNPPANSPSNALSLDNGAVRITLPTVAGQTYSLQYAQGSSGTDNGLPATNANWQVVNYVFTAAQNNQLLLLDATGSATFSSGFANALVRTFVTNTLLDDFELTTVPDNLYYQPEQDISGITGTSAFGDWQLEVLDNRAGAGLTNSLVSWQLGFTFANTNFTNPTLTFTNDGGPITNTIPGGSIQWYLINVPTNADFATNALLFANLPLNLWFSTNVPPTTTNSGDVLLLPNSTGGTNLLGTNGSPLNLTSAYIIPGSTYYLGVQNSNVTTAAYAFNVTFHLNLLFSGPTVITEPATNIVSGSATLNGLVTPNSTNTTVYFDYGTDTNYLSGPTASVVLTNNYSTPQWVSIDVTNLLPGQVYYFRAVGYNIYGTNYDVTLTFTNPYATPAPFAFTAPATLATGSSAQLNGFATPNGTAAIAWFEWGTSTGYGITTPAVAIGTNYNVVFVTNQISGLMTNLPYHYRLVVSNIVGVTHGFDQIFDQANVVAWGADFLGQTTPIPSNLTNLVVGIGAGYDFSLAVNNDGTVVAWGDNTFGQTNVPVGLTNAVFVGGGEKDSLALRSDRTVLVWGSNQFHQTNAPSDLTNIVAAASGGYHCLALRADGNPVAWGLSSSGQTNVPTGLSNIVAVAGGDLHSLALKNDGTVVAWGYNADGETNVPAGLTNVVAIAAGYYHNLALKSDGMVVAWGYNADGETNVNPVATNVIAISAGGFHSMALKNDGTVVFWGDNSSAQYPPPVPLTNVVAIVGGGLHSLALSSLFGLNQTNNPPFWTNNLANTTVTMNELTTNSVSNTATDTNVPAQTLSYTLLTNSLAWVSINPASGIITFTPQEVDGPSTNVITTVVTDNGHPALSATNSFTLVVNEVNVPPFWTNSFPTVTMNELTTNTVVATAQDSDIPTNTLTYRLTNSPAWAVINTNSGSITLTPQEVNGPGTNTITVVVTDNGAPPLSATTNFTVIVNEVNTAPFWPTNVPSQTNFVIGGGSTLTVTNTATDSDIPTNALSYTISVSPAANAPTISSNGIITWIPQATNVYTLTTIVTDTNPWAITNQSLSATNYITVTVTNQPASPTNATIPTFSIIATNIGGSNGFLLTWFAPSNDLFQVQWIADLTSTNWNTFTNIISYNTNVVANPTNTQFNFFDDGSQTGGSFGTARFYRIIFYAPPSSSAVAFAMTLPVQAVTDTNAQLNGFATPNGSPSTAWFEWGASRYHGSVTALVNVGSGSRVVYVTNLISGLIAGQTFHYCLVVSNAAAVVRGADQEFSEGGIVAWGDNNDGQTNVPVNLSNVVAIAAGGFNSLALQSGGIVLAWGDNTYGQTNVPAGLNGALAVASGYNHNLVLKNDGTAIAWGDNFYNQTNVPVNLSNVVAIAAGAYHNLVLKNDGTVVSWGQSSRGQTNVPVNLSNVVAIAGGIYHSLALKNDGTLVAWGAGMTNSGVLPDYGQSIIPSGLNNVVAIAAGGHHSLALKNDGTVIAWGWNGYGQTNVPIGLSNVVAVAAGVVNSMALKNDGTVVVWGDNTYGQANVPVNLTNAVAVAGGIYHDLSLASASINTLVVPSITNVSAGTNGVPLSATNGLMLQWSAPVYEAFQVQWATNLNPVVNWFTFPDDITSTTGAFSFTDTNAAFSMKFYRLILLP